MISRNGHLSTLPTTSGVETRYLVDDLNPTGYPQVVEELSGAGAVERQYTYGLQRIDEQQVLNGTWTPSFYGYDGGGNVRQLTNGAGAVTDTYEYDAFGNALQTSGSTPNVYLYRGEQYDADLGLYYLRARYYNPATGRFRILQSTVAGFVNSLSPCWLSRCEQRLGIAFSGSHASLQRAPQFGLASQP